MKINHRMSHTLLMATNFNLCQQIVLYANLGLSQITFSLCPLVNRNISYKKALKTSEMLTCAMLYNLPFIWPVTKKMKMKNWPNKINTEKQCWWDYFCKIKLSIEGNGLCTSEHYKPTDSHSYLLYSSSHPSHVKNYIPYSQFLWPRHLCSEDSDFSLKQSGEMCDFFDKRGYSAAICCSSRPSLRPSYSHRRNTTVSLETYPLYSIP